jgi:uncharacterized membrane protein YhhN
VQGWQHIARDTIAAMTSRPWLAAAALLSALLAIASAPWALSLPVLNYVFKPLTTVLVIGLAWARGQETPLLRCWVLVGLVFSLIGDVCLMWPKQGFLPGLVSFLLAHLAYLAAFTRTVRFAARPLVFVGYGVVALAILSLLWPGVPGALRGPVMAYVVCLACMAAQAAVVWRSGLARGGLLAASGALFMTSDALLATNKFAAALPLSSLWILGTYWAAQWCIACWLPPASKAGGGLRVAAHDGEEIKTAGSPPAR